MNPARRRTRRVVRALASVCGLVLAVSCEAPRPLEVTAREAPAASSWRVAPTDLLQQPLESSEGAWSASVVPPDPIAPAMLLTGWSQFESSGPLRYIWSTGPKSSFRIFVDTPDQLAISIRARAFAHPDAQFEKQRITASLNGERFDEFAIGASIEHRVLRLPVDRVKRGWNRIEFAYAWTQAPAGVVPGSVDERELAVAYEEVRVLRSRHTTDAVTVRGAGAPDAQPALLQRSAGDFSYLLRIPQDARLEVGWTAASGGGAAQLRIEIETDEGAAALFEGAAVRDGRAHTLDLDLAAWSGRFARLRFALGDLPPGAHWYWTKLALVAASPAVEVVAAPAPSLRGINVVFVLLDASNRAHFGPWGSDRGTTPNLDALVPESLVFDAAHAHASYTLASTASLFTSLLPPQHGVVEKRDRLGPEPPTLASALQQAGYATAAFSANIFVARAFGMERGFETFEELFRGKTGGVVAAATDFDAPISQWLDGVAAGARSGAHPFFLYVHFVQPHEPYDIAPRELYRGLDPAYRGPIDGSVASMYKVYDGQVTPDADDVVQLQRLYEGNIRFADAALGRLVERLRREDLLDRTLLIVTSDHGEAMGEGGRFGHNSSVDESMTAIPLLVRLPAALRRTGRLSQNVGSIDLAPMILETAALPVPATFQGRNPLRSESGSGDDRVIYARSAGAPPQVALWIDDWKYVHDAGTRRLSRMDSADGVAADESAQRPVTMDFFEAARRSLEAGNPVRAESVGNLSSDERDALKALGYLRE